MKSKQYFVRAEKATVTWAEWEKEGGRGKDGATLAKGIIESMLSSDSHTCKDVIWRPSRDGL